MIKNISYRLQVHISKHGGRFVAYAPALDISTSAKTEKALWKNVEILTSIFFEELTEAGTTKEVLTELGWKKQQKKWSPPRVSSRSIGITVPSFA